MARQLEPMSAAHVAALPGACGDCAAWQRDPLAVRGDGLSGPARRGLKAEWFETVRAEHGDLGWVLVEDGAVTGYILYAPPVTVPRVEAFPTAPPSVDALVLVGLWAGDPAGYKPLVHRAVKAARARGAGALEAFGGGVAPQGCQTRPATGTVPCRFPHELLDRLGFVVVREHPSSARYRLDVGSAIPVLDQLEHGVAGLARALGRRAAAEPGVSRTHGEAPRVDS